MSNLDSQKASTHVEAFNAILDAYQNIGEQIPLLADFELMASNAHMKDILGMIYADILKFHREALRHFRKPCMAIHIVPMIIDFFLAKLLHSLEATVLGGVERVYINYQAHRRRYETSPRTN